MGFGFSEVVLLICAGLWLLHAAQLARLPFRRTWPSFVITGLGLGVTLLSWWWVPRFSASVGVVLVVVLLVTPAVLTRTASRELRWGRIGRARALAGLAFAVRPIAAQRRFRRAVEISWQLGRQQDVDLERAVDSLGPLTLAERRAHRVAFLSWTNDFERMATELADPKVRALAMRAGMAAITTTVMGETVSDAGLLAHWLHLKQVPTLRGRGIDATWALLLMAAYLGDVTLVREQMTQLADDIPPERLAFALATAQQRAGHPEQAEATIEAALSNDGLLPASAARLRYRVDHPRPPLRDDAAFAEAREEVAARLRARQVLAALGLGVRQPGLLTSAIAAFLCGVFAWQTTQTRRAVFRGWGLNAPFSDFPDGYRLLSYACLHLDVGHLLVNVLGLLVFGRFVERHFGPLRHLVIYLSGAVGGGVAYLAFAQGRGVAIGASGAVLGLFGATVARVAFDRELRRSEEGRATLLFLTAVAALQLVVDAVWAQSSGSAHAGGLAAGLVVGALLLRRSRMGGGLR